MVLGVGDGDFMCSPSKKHMTVATYGVSSSHGMSSTYTKEETRRSKLKQLETSRRLQHTALILYAALTAANGTSWSRLLANGLSEEYSRAAAAAAGVAKTTLRHLRGCCHCVVLLGVAIM